MTKDYELAVSLWEDLGNIPIDGNDCIEEEFNAKTVGVSFGIGTDRFDIWHWFEDTFNISVAVDLMRIHRNKP